jgi:hypothetical protein
MAVARAAVIASRAASGTPAVTDRMYQLLFRTEEVRRYEFFGPADELLAA